MNKKIYVIYSNSYRLMEDELKKIIKDNKYTSYNLDEIELDDVLNDAAYFSLFGDLNYMVLRNVMAFSTNRKGSELTSKDEYLLNYLNDPNPNTVLIMILKEKMNGTKKVSKIIKEKFNYIEINNPNQKVMREIINTFLKKNKIKMDYDSVTYIINGLDNNYDLIMNELDKLLLYPKKEFTLNDINKIIACNVLDNNFKFLDYIMNKDIKNAFKYYDDFLLNKNSPIMLMSMLANEYRNVYLTKKLLKKHSKNDIMSILDIRYTFQVDKLINYSYSYKERDLESYILKLCDLDYDIKQGKITDRLALELFILKVCN